MAQSGVQTSVLDHFLESKHHQGIVQDGVQDVDLLRTFWTLNTMKGWSRKSLNIDVLITCLEPNRHKGMAQDGSIDRLFEHDCPG